VAPGGRLLWLERRTARKRSNPASLSAVAARDVSACGHHEAAATAVHASAIDEVLDLLGRHVPLLALVFFRINGVLRCLWRYARPRLGGRSQRGQHDVCATLGISFLPGGFVAVMMSFANSFVSAPSTATMSLSIAAVFASFAESHCARAS